MSPFVPDSVKEWLEDCRQTESGQLSHLNTLLQQDVLLCYEQGLEAALKLIESPCSCNRA